MSRWMIFFDDGFRNSNKQWETHYNFWMWVQVRERERNLILDLSCFLRKIIKKFAEFLSWRSKEIGGLEESITFLGYFREESITHPPMETSIPSDKLSFLHKLLDKELEGLKESSLSNSHLRSADGLSSASQ